MKRHLLPSAAASVRCPAPTNSGGFLGQGRKLWGRFPIGGLNHPPRRDSQTVLDGKPAPRDDSGTEGQGATRMIHFRQIDPARNRARFYSLTVTRTLWGEVVLVRRWGRIGTAGQGAETAFAEPVSALRALRRAARRRRARGYLLMRR